MDHTPATTPTHAYARAPRRIARGPMDVVETLKRSRAPIVRAPLPQGREGWVALWTGDGGMDTAAADALYDGCVAAGVVPPEDPREGIPSAADPAAVVGAEAVERLRRAHFAVVPFDVPDYAVGEAMTWTGCGDANLVWEALNCALNMIADRHDYNPAALERLARLGRGEIDLETYRAEGGS